MHPARAPRPPRIPLPGGAARVLAACCALIFAAVTWQVAARGPLRSLDERIGRAARGRLLPGRLAEFFADLGNMAVALPVLGAALVYTGLRLRRAGVRWWPPPLAAAAAMAAVPLIVAPLKALVDRPAPPGPLAGTEGFYPSGHTATATVAYGGAALLVLLCHGTERREDGGLREDGRHREDARHHEAARRREDARHRDTRGPRRRVAVAVAAAVALLNLCVGTGLVLRGYHWPLDVIGGWCLSGVLLSGVLQTAATVVRNRLEPPHRVSRRTSAGRRPHASPAPAPPDR
ncbi:phosphatase PAP2 family protein [Streptomyces sp. P1-3]|uniref:phosphatase PAP2 family protein n=1 Tax=Streptomyces sp. P1-3 TaxID=3421658 RepID=UPI003D36E030